jgi:CopG family nickel-responsive transcriptional regulator
MDQAPLSSLARLSISLPSSLLVELDEMVAERGLPSRSQMIAELIRRSLAEHCGDNKDGLLAGTITLVYRACPPSGP